MYSGKIAVPPGGGGIREKLLLNIDSYRKTYCVNPPPVENVTFSALCKNFTLKNNLCLKSNQKTKSEYASLFMLIFKFMLQPLHILNNVTLTVITHSPGRKI
jgi:hypothetical protein